MAKERLAPLLKGLEMKHDRANCSKGELTPEHSAAYDFVDSMIEEKQVDKYDGIAPMWYGWALREAFLAGVEYERERNNDMARGDLNRCE
jgi:hypothetical protein